MPQRKDPDIPVRMALACVPGRAPAPRRFEQLVTRRIEEKIAENAKVEKIESNTRTGVTAVSITLVDGTRETGKEFDDIKLKLDAIQDLPDGAGPIDFVKDFGDTAALMLTVASPKVGEVEIAARAQALQRGIEATRAAAESRAARVTLAHGPPRRRPGHAGAPTAPVACRGGHRPRASLRRAPSSMARDSSASTLRVGRRRGQPARRMSSAFIRDRLRASEFHPDAWPPVVVRDPPTPRPSLAAVAGDKYTYRELDDYHRAHLRHLQTAAQSSRRSRAPACCRSESILEYSQERLAAYGVTSRSHGRPSARATSRSPGGIIEVGRQEPRHRPVGRIQETSRRSATCSSRPSAWRPRLSPRRRRCHPRIRQPAAFLNFYTAAIAEGDVAAHPRHHARRADAVRASRLAIRRAVDAALGGRAPAAAATT